MREFNYLFAKGLQIGLRTSDKNRRNYQALVQSDGMVPQDEALASVEELDQLDISSISPAPEFPYPQLFKLNMVSILCTATAIYEVDSLGSLTQVLSGLTEGHVWSVADFGNFVLLANGKQCVYRAGDSGEWTADSPYGMAVASSVCNFNGQVIVAAPNVTIPD